MWTAGDVGLRLRLIRPAELQDWTGQHTAYRVVNFDGWEHFGL